MPTIDAPPAAVVHNTAPVVPTKRGAPLPTTVAEKIARATELKVTRAARRRTPLPHPRGANGCCRQNRADPSPHSPPSSAPRLPRTAQEEGNGHFREGRYKKALTLYTRVFAFTTGLQV